MSKYKKIAKNLLIENAWDRKFGEPLPTLEDVMKEAESMSLQPKGGGQTVVFKNKDNYEKAKKSGDYEEPEETDDGGEKEDPSGKLGAGDFDRDGDRSADAGDDKGGEPDAGEEKPTGPSSAYGAEWGDDTDGIPGYTTGDNWGKEKGYGKPGHKSYDASDLDKKNQDAKEAKAKYISSPDYDAKKASEDFEKAKDDADKKGISGSFEDNKLKKLAIERGQRATAIASGEVVPNSPEDSNMALDHSKQAVYQAREKGDDDALKKAKDAKKAVKTVIKQQAKKQGWKTSFGSGRVKTENANSITINGKTYKKIQEQKKVTDKHPLRETYEKIGGM